jgi:hypothetical protein
MERGKSDKKGLSTIIVTVILIGLSLAAIVIVWVVVSNLLNTGAADINIRSKCLEVNIAATYANCTTGGNCTVLLERTGTGSEDIGGVKFVFKNVTDSSPVVDVSGNVPQLSGRRVTVANPLNATNDVEVTAYFTDTTGNHLCTNTNGFGF